MTFERATYYCGICTRFQRNRSKCEANFKSDGLLKLAQLLLFYEDKTPLFSDPIGLDEVFQAYFDCRRNKRSTSSAVAFESNYEENLIRLHEEINDGSYMPGRSTAFIVEKPVKREIFAADFRDRVVHHLVINKMNYLFEREFIYDSYSCRTGKGTHLGIQRLDRFIRKCSRNYSRDCYILKLDIRGFFMHINRNTLFNALRVFLIERYVDSDRDTLIGLCRSIIHRDPACDCIITGSRSAWDGLPPDKSLFHAPPECGLPIGNLTSQVFANFYLNGFDHFVKHSLGERYYGRYVDDCVLVHEDKDHLASLIPLIQAFLWTKLGLTLHPNKVSIQHCREGVKFLGVVIKPWCIYIANRTKGNFYHSVGNYNLVAESHKPDATERSAFLNSMNSYLGILKHYQTWRLRSHILRKHISALWWKTYRPDDALHKIVLKANNLKVVWWKVVW